MNKIKIFFIRTIRNFMPILDRAIEMPVKQHFTHRFFIVLLPVVGPCFVLNVLYFSFDVNCKYGVKLAIPTFIPYEIHVL